MTLRRKDSRVVSVLGFSPITRPSDNTSIEPHSTTALGAGAQELGIPRGANAIMMQAITQNVRYTLSGTDPTNASGFALIAGNDPIVLEIDPQTTILKVIAGAAGAILEFQWGTR